MIEVVHEEVGVKSFGRVTVRVSREGLGGVRLKGEVMARDSDDEDSRTRALVVMQEVVRIAGVIFATAVPCSL